MSMSFISHSFHLVSLSPWPLIGSFSAGLLALGAVTLLHKNCGYLLFMGLFSVIFCMALWWRDVIREATYQGSHTKKVIRGIEMGMILFIISEVMFFVAFFWAFFHSSLAPSPELGCQWPPEGVLIINPFSIPLLNTAVLLSSGATVTWAHHGLLNNYKCELSWGLGTTVALGMYFTFLQMAEYFSSSFSVSDSVYGSAFFVATGFHGFHVMIGSAFLLVCLIRARLDHFSPTHHTGLEAAAWYWHFVDVVWLFLYLCLYWWSF